MAIFIVWENPLAIRAILRCLMNKVCIVPASPRVMRHKFRAMEVFRCIFLVLDLLTLWWSTAWKVLNAILFAADFIRVHFSLPIAMVFALLNAMQTLVVRR